MPSRNIGPLSVQPIGLGCMNLSSGYEPANDDESLDMLQKAVHNGYDFFDSATLYGAGHSEQMVGKALKSVRKDIVLASKCGLDSGGIDGRPATIHAQCDASLKRLDTDVIDLYYLHRVDPKVPIAESVGALQQLIDAGKIRALGLSEVSSETLKSALKEAPVAALQSEYSLWSRTPELGVLDICEANDVTFVPFCPLGRGFLADSASELASLGEKDLRRTIAHPRFEGVNFDSNSKLLDKFKQVALRLECTPAQLSLAWLLAQRNASMVPIPGTTKLPHLIENARAVDVELDEATINELNVLINEKTVAGNRYNDARMAEADSERDRANSSPA